MNIFEATKSYEKWLARYIKLIPGDLRKKHQGMSKDAFLFFRATFYRWMQLIPNLCGDSLGAPAVLSVGDLHVENFGTWRDMQGRLVWGINDFDEACELPYTIDLIRLATSACLAINQAHLLLEHARASDSILAGYKDGLNAGGAPFVLGEHHLRLREMVTGNLRNPAHFWAKFDDLSTLRTPVPASARKAIEKMSPSERLEYGMVHRLAGMGSLGRERYTAIAHYRGGRIARETKALAPSACVWAETKTASSKLRYREILDRSVRSPDPFMRLEKRWIVRRLAPDCTRVELASLPKDRDELKLLYSMGFETANVHLGTKKAAKKIARDLQRRSPEWLHLATVKMAQTTMKEWKQWRAHNRRSS